MEQTPLREEIDFLIGYFLTGNDIRWNIDCTRSLVSMIGMESQMIYVVSRVLVLRLLMITCVNVS